ncbi:FecR family protein [Komagataeibacter oboediens]|uniref:FecR protein domain-containing protein n=1 Tax=Komagataeibacter oboediens TaxID=65958 RepID=A0ABS5SR30_9PROT|nr:FecR domain-containing protein [Komagataeibacter oboediens]MBT0676757.1 hypothetical protein [Komagataeibacter oboediens]MBT0680074.1 hypothetical protein [Komagataeibacter oboediens]
MAWFIAPDVLLRLRADAQTSTAETRDMALADGSHIRLAPKSAIALDCAGGRRHVTLLAGEAFFTVTHDASHPFVVTAGKVTTADIGTSFDIRRSGERVLVAVREGRVRVTGDPVRPGGEELAGGEALDIHQDTTHRALVAPDHIGAWGQGLLVADEEPMRDVVDHLRPWLTARVMVLSPQATRHITGTYTLNAPDEALEAIARAQQATLYHISPWLIVIR